MLPSGASPLPPTITPVFDVKNHWVALCINLGPQARPDDSVLEALCAQSEDVSSISRLPQLFMFNDLQPESEVLKALAGPASGPQRYLRLPAAVLADEQFANSLAALVARGIKFMMQGLPAQPALGHADRTEALEMDFGGQTNGVEAISLLRRLPGPHLAFQVGSYAAHRQCAQLGYQWFQGDWALHPEVEQGSQQATSSRSFLMNLLTLVASDADSSEIEALLKRDLNLSFQLLKLVNSVSFSLNKKISSFGQAITLLGRRQLQRWLQLLLYAGHHNDGSVSPLLGIAALRAALMEGLMEARGGKQNDKDRAYMVGMFSLLDVLFDAPIENLVKPLGLDEDITQALIAREGTLGRLLDVVIASTAPPSEALGQQLAELDISAAVFLAAQMRAHAWAAQVCREI